MEKQSLNGLWSMRICGDDKEFPAMIPGSVLSCLLDQGEIEDPYYRDNEYQTRELFRKDFEFKNLFVVEKEMLEQKQIDLVCYGLDTICEIYINGEKLADTNNMHRTYRFSVKELLSEGENEILVVIKSPIHYMEQYVPGENREIKFVPCGCMEKNQYIRKAHSMFGWDWGPQIPDAGIFRDIELEAYSQAKIEDVVISQIHENNQVSLDVDVSLDVISADTYEIETVLRYPGEQDFREVMLIEKMDVSEHQVTLGMSVKNPKLWWPNGLGEQPLYKLFVILKKHGKILEEKEYTIGLRTLTVSQEKDQWGSEFCFCINGIKIFSKGANYIPEDCVYSRITKSRIEYLISSAVRANYNTIRVWGGGYYPSDEFYELCNEYGLIVWQDLMYACNVYELTDEFAENIVAETMDNVKRLRHHPCLGLWCGNNEIESAWHHWPDFVGHSEYLRMDYIKQFEYLLPKAVKSQDSATYYWPSSPSSGGCFDDPDDENRGDTHYWSVWHGQKPFSDYLNHYFRFCSEFGFQSFPSLKTVLTFTEEEDRNIFSKIMESHQKNEAANGKMLYYLSENFKYPKDFESLLYATQILQAVAIKTGVEHWRRNRGRCMGSLYWQLNDNWPVASWASIDYFGRWKALHYFAKNFYANVAGSIQKVMDKHGECIGAEAYVQNESREAATVKVILSLKTMNLETLATVEEEVEVAPFSVKKICAIGMLNSHAKEELVITATYEYEDGTISYDSEPLLPYKHMNLPKGDISIQVQDEGDAYEIHLQSNVYQAYVELDFEDVDVIFNDNYICITDEQERVLSIRKEDIQKGSFLHAEDVKNRLRIRSLRDTF